MMYISDAIPTIKNERMKNELVKEAIIARTKDLYAKFWLKLQKIYKSIECRVNNMNQNRMMKPISL